MYVASCLYRGDIYLYLISEVKVDKDSYFITEGMSLKDESIKQ